MITKEEMEKAGYTVLPQGGWIRLDPEIIPRDWYDVCKDFGVDPHCKEMVLCVCGVLEVNEEDEENLEIDLDGGLSATNEQGEEDGQ